MRKVAGIEKVEVSLGRATTDVHLRAGSRSVEIVGRQDALMVVEAVKLK